jgi:hypothetical protein
MIENGFVQAVEKAVENDKRQAKKQEPKRQKLRRMLKKNHEKQLNEKGFANVNCSKWSKTDQKRILKLMMIEGYKENTIKRLWNLNKL